MNLNSGSSESEAERSLDATVRSVLAEALPEDAIARVKQRAKMLAQPDLAPAINARESWYRPKASKHWYKTWAMVAASAAAVLVWLSAVSHQDSVAWGKLLNALRVRPWVHGTTTYSDGHQSQTSEFWFSGVGNVIAGRYGDLFEFQDLESGIAWKFNARTDVIERVPALKVRGNMVTDLQLPMVLHSLINPSHEPHDVLGGERILKTSSGRVEEGEHEWTEFLIRVQKANNASDERVVRVRLNAESQLPALWEVRDANGATAVTLFDYPANGPTNIFDLGVPKTATVIDHVPTGELSHIIESLKADRGRFDDYDAIAVEQLEGTKTKFDPSFKNSSIKRIRRSGHRYRIDQLLTAKRTLAAPSKDESMGEWWLNNREQFWSVPQLLCDGQHTSLYQMTDGRIIPLTKPNLSVILAKENTGRLPSDDPAVEWPSLMPEYSCRPHLWEFDENRSFEMTPKADDGPPGSIRVVVSGSRGRWSGELYRYWFDPKRNYVLLQSTATFFKKDSDLVPLTTTDKFDDFTQSPSGKWFPQLVRRTTTDPQAAGRTEVTRFYVDFAVDLPAGLFSSLHAENDE